MVGVVIGNYQLVRKLGEGGMGAVYLGQHTLLGRRAAIKVLLPALSARPDVVNRFFNEARAVTSISDPGIVQVFDFGYHTDGSAFIVMEYLEGEPLDQRLAKLRRLPVHEALRLCRQLATSLAAAHAEHIVHRDLKPENIFLVRDAEVASGERSKILDFGIAKLSDDHPGKIKTHTGTLMGTPVYMSPEQCRGVADIDHRSDIYSLGCVLYLLLTGRPPFDGEGMGDIISAHIREPVTPPSAIAGGIAPPVDALVLRCLAKAPAERFATMSELAATIGALLQQVPFDAAASYGGGYVAAAPGSVPPGAPGSMPPYHSPAMPTPAPHLAAAAPTTLGSGAGQMATGAPRRSRVGLWISAGLIAAAAVIGIVVVSGGRGGDRAAVAAAVSNAPAAPPAPTVAAAPPAPTVAAAPPAPDATAAPAMPNSPAIETAAEPAAPVAKPEPSKKPSSRSHERTRKAAMASTASAAAATTTAAAATPPPAPATPAGPPPSPPSPPPAPPAAHPTPAASKCSKADFAAVYDAAAPAPAVVRSALRSLKQCREAGAISDADFERYQSALVAKL